MTTPKLNQCWRIPLEADLRHREWEGEHVFFHGAAGDTHRFSEAAAQVLLHLMTTSATETELSVMLAEAAEVDQAEAEAALGAILAELERIEYAELVQ
jgi:PqqD family protein of HPr-rel-A system